MVLSLRSLPLTLFLSLSLSLTMCIPSLDSQCNLVQYDDMMGVGGKVQPTKAQPVLDAA